MGAVMNQYYTTTVLILFYFSFTSAQIDTLSLSYYPLRTGTYWEYHEHEVELWTPFYWDYYYSIQVLGDSLLSNGKFYKILEKLYLDSTQAKYLLFERIDTTSCNVYRYSTSAPGNEYLLDSLKSQIGDTTISGRNGEYFSSYPGYVCTDIYSDTVLDIATTSKEFECIFPLHPATYKLSIGFGLTYFETGWDFGYLTRELRYAVIDSIEYGTPLHISHVKNDMNVVSLKLYQNFPNPFNPLTRISYILPQSNHVHLTIYDLMGRKIQTMVNEYQAVGSYSVDFDASHLSSGIYFYQLKVGNNFVATKKMIVTH
jgi:hypothetical protein